VTLQEIIWQEKFTKLSYQNHQNHILTDSLDIIIRNRDNVHRLRHYKLCPRDLTSLMSLHSELNLCSSVMCSSSNL